MDASKNVTCPASPAGNCVIEATIVVQVLSTTSADNRMSFCPYIDNVVFNPTGACPLVGVLPVNRYEAFTFTWAKYNVTPGVHKLRTSAQVDANALLGLISIKYDVYK
jgi:hypothetical protein